jgi:hypothetical protein
VWSRSHSLTLGGDENYYRDGSCGVEVFLWHWEEMKVITETGLVVQKSFSDTERRWQLLQRWVVWNRNISLTLGGDASYYRDGSCGVEVFLWHWEEMKVITEKGPVSPPSVRERLLLHTTHLCNNFHLLPVSEKDFYSTRTISVIKFISSQCQRKTFIPHDRRGVWSRSLSLTLRGDESYYRDGSCGVEVFLWYWEEMEFITETGRVE